MPELPTAALSKSFQEALKDRKLQCAVFTTFELDPEFFEEEILPIFLDMPLSHAASIRRVQMEDALRVVPGEVAVYYDANGLCVGNQSSARQDVRRIPVRLRRGIFHPKLVFALVSSPMTDDPEARGLIVGTLSANLTRSGWWENVEVAFIDEICAGQPSRMARDLAAFLKRLCKLAPGRDHAAADEIRRFLHKVPSRKQRSEGGLLHTHLAAGDASVPDWIADVTGSSLRGMNLEVVSPYFDDAAACVPLEVLIDKFNPKEVRILLPVSRSGVVGCSERLFDAVKGLTGKTAVHWGTLPDTLLRRGNGNTVSDRFVHAKLYRFFRANPAREIFVCGSINLTNAAHQRGGNMEAAVITETKKPHRPSFWLTRLEARPVVFENQQETETASLRGTRLQLRYDWTTGSADAWWDDDKSSPKLTVSASGLCVATISALPSRAWEALEKSLAAEVARGLRRTSLFEVEGDRDDAAVPLLVQEDGMANKPSLLFELSPADILKYWSLLTPAQRAAFIETRGANLAQGEDAFPPRLPALSTDNDLFSTIAGIFHAFGALERSITAALERGHTKEAIYRLFGSKYDSLGNLLEGVLREQGEGDTINQFLIMLCARQMCDAISVRYPEFWQEHEPVKGGPREALAKTFVSKDLLLARNGPEFAGFLKWFESQFLQPATPRHNG
jgi:hypothetical protein